VLLFLFLFLLLRRVLSRLQSLFQVDKNRKEEVEEEEGESFAQTMGEICVVIYYMGL